MELYYLKGILYNKKRYTLIAIISIIGFSFIFMMMQLLQTLFNDKNTTDFEEMSNILMIFSIIIMTSIVAMLSTVYKILYQARKTEIINLREIGCRKFTIKKMFFFETLVSGIFISVLSMLLGALVTNIFNHYYNAPVRMTIFSFIVYFVVTVLVFCITVNREFKKCLQEVFCQKKLKKELLYDSRKSVNTLLVCAAIIISYFLLKIFTTEFKFIFQYIEALMLDEIIIMILSLVCIKPIIYLLFVLISTGAQKLKLVNVSIGLKHIMHDISRTLKLVGNLVFSIALLLFMLVMFNSIPQSTIASLEKNFKYDYVYVDLNDSQENKNISLDYENSIIASTLEIKAESDKGKNLLIKGVDEKYKNAELFDIVEGSENKLISNNTNHITAIISGLDAQGNNWNIGELVNIKINEKNIIIKIVGINNSYTYGEIFVNKDVLSKILYNKENVENTWYTNAPIEELQVRYNNIIGSSRENVIAKAKEAILSGTEIIEAFLYIYVISSYCMLFNIFIVTLDERKLINSMMSDIGISKNRIHIIQKFEISTTILIGVIVGVLLACWTIRGLPEIVEMLYRFKITIIIPSSVYFIFCGLTGLSIVSIKILTRYTSKSSQMSLDM